MKSYLVLITLLISTQSLAIESRCFGTTAKGKLQNGVQLPYQGENYIAYGRVPSLLGRTYVHSKVSTILLDAYQSLHKSHPHHVFKYAETGFKNGGRFKPHKTHRNGLSVDFIVPVLDKNNRSVYLPTHSANKYGYNIHFNNKGRYRNYKIDFEAIGAHIVALDKSAKKQGATIWRVLFAPDLQPLLYKTKQAHYLKKFIMIPRKRSWVRHDEHYHVDFKIKCNTL